LAFLLWGVLLSGIFSPKLGSPGLLQLYRLEKLFDAKKAELSALEVRVESMESQAQRLEKNPLAQEREVRRVLGYVTTDELIIDIKSQD
jgi:cell division protein FtsB